MNWILDMVTGPGRASKRHQRKSRAKASRSLSRRSGGALENLEPRLVLSGVSGVSADAALLAADPAAAADYSTLSILGATAKDGSKGDGSKADIYEPNNTLAEAVATGSLGTITSGPAATFNLPIMQDATDWYTFTLDAAGDANSAIQVDGGAALDLDMAVYHVNAADNTLGSLIQDANDSTPNPRISLNGQAAGVFAARVTSTNFNSAGDPYTITITPAAAQDDNYEHYQGNTDNNTAAKAWNFGQVVGAKAPVTNLKLLDAADWYKFQTLTGGAAQVSISFTNAQGNLDLFVYQDAGVTQIGTGGQTTGDGETVTFTADAQPHVYYVKVVGAGGATNPNYSLSLTGPTLTDDAYGTHGSQAAVDSQTAGPTTANFGVLTSATPAVRDNGVLVNPTGGAEDWYKFQMNGTGTTANSVRIDFTNANGDLALTVYKDDGAGGLTVVGINDTIGDFEQVSLDGQTPGTYYAVINSGNGDYSPYYKLTVTPAVTADDAYEDNDTPALVDAHAGTPGTAGQPNLGTLTARKDITGLAMADTADYYKFTMGGPGTPVTFAQVTYTEAQGALTLTLLDSTGNTTVATAPTTTPGVRAISLDGVAANTYYLKVTGGNPSYSLSIVPGLADDQREGTGNDTQAQVDAMTVGAANSSNLGPVTTFTDSALTLADEADWYKFNVGATGGATDKVSITLDPAQGDLDLQLYDSTGTLLITSASSTATTETISLTDRPAGTYYAKVYGAFGAVNAHYTLDIRAPAAGDDIYDQSPNNNDDASSPAPLGSFAQQGTIENLVLNDDDWYQIDLPNDGDVNSKIVISYAPGQAELTAALYFQGTGSFLDPVAVSAPPQAGTSTVVMPLYSAIDGPISSGTYDLWVHAATPGGTNSSYSIQIIPGTPAPDAYEPNNSAADADRATGLNSPNLGTFSGNSALSAQIPVGDEDWFRFTTVAGLSTGVTANVTMNFTAGIGDLDLAIYRLNPDSTVVQVGTVGTGGNQRTIDFPVNPSTTYYAKVYSPTGGSNNYDLSVTLPAVAPTVNLDVDGNGVADALTDGLLILRYLFQFNGTSLTSGALGVSPPATRTDPAAIISYLDDATTTMLDVDANTAADALTDGLLILRYLFQFNGASLTSGALGVNPPATRTDPAAIITFLDGFQPAKGASAKGAETTAADTPVQDTTGAVDATYLVDLASAWETAPKTQAKSALAVDLLLAQGAY